MHRIILRGFNHDMVCSPGRTSPKVQLSGIESADMPNSKNAIKELRKSRSRRLRNRSQRSTLRTVVKKVRQAAEAQDREGAEQRLSSTPDSVQHSSRRLSAMSRNRSSRAPINTSMNRRRAQTIPPRVAPSLQADNCQEHAAEMRWFRHSGHGRTS